MPLAFARVRIRGSIRRAAASSLRGPKPHTSPEAPADYCFPLAYRSSRAAYASRTASLLLRKLRRVNGVAVYQRLVEHHGYDEATMR